MVVKDKPNTVLEPRRVILSAYGPLMSGSEQNELLYWVMRTVLVQRVLGEEAEDVIQDVFLWLLRSTKETIQTSHLSFPAALGTCAIRVASKTFPS